MTNTMHWSFRALSPRSGCALLLICELQHVLVLTRPHQPVFMRSLICNSLPIWHRSKSQTSILQKWSTSIYIQFYSRLLWLKSQDISYSVFPTNLIRLTINLELEMACWGSSTVKSVEAVPPFYWQRSHKSQVIHGGFYVCVFVLF